MASANTSYHQQGDLHDDDESLLDDDMIEADDGKKATCAVC